MVDDVTDVPIVLLNDECQQQVTNYMQHNPTWKAIKTFPVLYGKWPFTSVVGESCRHMEAKTELLLMTSPLILVISLIN